MAFLDSVLDLLTATVTVGPVSIPYLWSIVIGVSLLALVLCARRRMKRRKHRFDSHMEMGTHQSPLTGAHIGRGAEERAPPKGRRSVTHTIGRKMARALHIPVNDWTEHKTEDGTPYWVNRVTGSSTWNKPAELSPWAKSQDDQGRTYYFNRDTGEARWTNPHHDEVGHNEGLPTGWQKIEDSNGRSYYYEAKTGVSQWEKPTATEGKSSVAVSNNDDRV